MRKINKTKLIGLFMATIMIAIVLVPASASACPCEDPIEENNFMPTTPINTIQLQYNIMDFYLILRPIRMNTERLNNDQLFDVVVSRTRQNKVDVYFGVDDNSFTEPISFSANKPRGTSIFYGDFDDDLDLAVANSGSYSVTIYMNSGESTFQISQEIQLDYRPFSILYHIDRYYPDLIIFDMFNIPRTALLNNFDGTFYPIPFDDYNLRGDANDCGPEPDCNPNAGEGIQECMRAAWCRYEKCWWQACVMWKSGEWSWLRHAAAKLACAALVDVEIAVCIPGGVIPK